MIKSIFHFYFTKRNYIRQNTRALRRKKLIRKNTPNQLVNHLLPSINKPKKWYGNHYGGFYIIPTLLHKDSVVYSFGIGSDISFDKTIIKRHHCTVHAFDPTPKSIQWITQQKLSSKFVFHDFGISETSHDKHPFYLPISQQSISGSLCPTQNLDTKPIYVTMKSFKDITHLLNHTVIDLLKIDIEGAEYTVIPNILSSNIIIKQIVVEYHDRLYKKALSKDTHALLEQHGYKLFACGLGYEEASYVLTTQ